MWLSREYISPTYVFMVSWFWLSAIAGASHSWHGSAVSSGGARDPRETRERHGRPCPFSNASEQVPYQEPGARSQEPGARSEPDSTLPVCIPVDVPSLLLAPGSWLL